MNKPLFLFVGQSGSGKTTITEILESKYNYKSIRSYTTREKRYAEEDGHIFISDTEFNDLKNIVAYTEYNNFKYGTTKEQLDNAMLYVVDISGVETLLKNYKNEERPICIFYLNSTVTNRIERMIDRNDSDTAIIGRLHNDEMYDWYDKLNKIVWHYAKNEHRNVELYKINANGNISEVLDQILYYISLYIEY